MGSINYKAGDFKAKPEVNNFNAENFLKKRSGLSKAERLIYDWKQLPEIRRKFKSFGEFVQFEESCNYGLATNNKTGKKVGYDQFIMSILAEKRT